MAKKDHINESHSNSPSSEIEGLSAKLKSITRDGFNRHPNIGESSVNIGLGGQLSTKKWLVFNLLRHETNYFMLGFFTSKQELKIICSNQYRGVFTESDKELLFVGKNIMNDYIIDGAAKEIPELSFSKTSFMDSANFHFYFNGSSFKRESWTIRDEQFSIDFILIHLPQSEGEF